MGRSCSGPAARNDYMVFTKSATASSRLWGCDILDIFFDGANVAKGALHESSVSRASYSLGLPPLH